MKSFTLIETIVVIFVFTLIMGAVSGLIVMAYRSQGYTWQQSRALDEARRGIETMVREIREAKQGDDGSYPIEKSGDKEFVFYADIDKDGLAERVRYFLGTINSGSQTQECQTSAKGGNCSVTFSNFLKGILKSAQLRISVEGDLGASNEYAEVFADGTKLGNLCQTGCSDCAGAWQGTALFDVAAQANDNSIQFLADATSKVDPNCPHSMKMMAEFSFTEELAGLAHEFRKGVIKPVGFPPTYPSANEQVTILSSYIRNSPPIFEYYDQNGNKIEDYPTRLKDTKIMKVYLVVNVDLNRPPNDFELESYVQLRNLKTE
jgi:type II secretory pathway pseudopilin PulG